MHGELACDLPLVASQTEASQAARAIEQEVMALFEQNRAPLLRYSISLGVALSDAEEIVQEVFLSLFRHLQLGRSRHNLRGWIFRVAHNLTLRKRRADRRHLEATEIDSAIAESQPDPAPNPEESCSSAQRRQRLLAVVAALPHLDRSCLHLRAEGLRYREIAAALGISLGAVSISLARSVGKLIRADRG